VPLTELTRDRRTQLPVTYEPDAARVAISYPARPPHLLEIRIPCLKRIFAIACGYEDGDDLDRLRGDLVFKLAYGRLPDTGADLCSQPTVSSWGKRAVPCAISSRLHCAVRSAVTAASLGQIS
jgi:Transposase DDE domain group 1